MKNYFIIIILVTLFCNHHGFAQQGAFIHKTYPNEWIHHNGWANTYYDVNNDSVPDFVMHHELGYGGILEGRYHTMDNWDCCSFSTYQWLSSNNYYEDISLPLNSDILNWGYNLHPENNGIDTVSYKTGLRYYDEENYYYGWLRAFSTWDASINTESFIVTETCFCTIPNFPLKWGQTTLNDVDENDMNAFATVHPNPTNGLVSITGQDLKTAEVFNALGQRMATAKGNDEQMTIDLNGLPAGVYFVNVTDKEGRMCVRKIVKE